MGIIGRAFVALQHVVPQRLLSGLVYRATRWRWGPWKDFLITLLARLYRIDLDEPVRSHPSQFVHFNDFFTRELRDGMRPLAPEPDALLCPADGRISQAGPIRKGQLLQAKRHEYTVASLLGGREDLAAPFLAGDFATIYLAPHNYHRVHLPLAATLAETVYVPGRLFSVNPTTVAGVPGLFARNERLACLFDTEDAGRMAVVLVGAMLVSSIETVWGGEVPRTAQARATTFAPGAPRFERGAEIGRFNMGSTVIVLCETGRTAWPTLQPLAQVRMGERLAAVSSGGRTP